MNIARRLGQFLAAVTARVTPAERALVAEALDEPARRLFERMPLFDQRHCLDVYQTLVRAGHDDPALLRAALLHDCGKVADDGRPIPLIYYGLFVVLARLTPRLYARAVDAGGGLLWPFAVHAAHDARGAALLEAAGDAAAARVLRDYAARRMTTQAAALSWADNLN